MVGAVDERAEEDDILDDVERRLEGRTLVAVSPAWGVSFTAIGVCWGAGEGQAKRSEGGAGACCDSDRTGCDPRTRAETHGMASRSCLMVKLGTRNLWGVRTWDYGWQCVAVAAQLPSVRWGARWSAVPSRYHSLLALGELNLLGGDDGGGLVSLGLGRHLALAKGGRHVQ